MMVCPHTYRESIKNFDENALMNEEAALREKIKQLCAGGNGTEKAETAPSAGVRLRCAREYLQELEDEILSRAEHGGKIELHGEGFELVAEARTVFAVSDYYIPFEIGASMKERESAITAFKSRLCAAIRRLKIKDGEVLAASYAEDKTSRFFDLENMLFYNLGPSAFEAAAKNGLSFAQLEQKAEECRRQGVSDRPYAYCYRCVSAGQLRRHFDEMKTAVEWTDIPLDTKEKSSPAKYWKAIRANGSKVKRSSSQDSEPLIDFAVEVELCLPKPVKPANLMKPLLDGVICAFHGEEAGIEDCLTEFCKRSGCEELACPNTFSAVLEKRKYIHPYKNGTSFQWSPADDHCRAALLTVSYGGTAPTFRGKIYQLKDSRHNITAIPYHE